MRRKAKPKALTYSDVEKVANPVIWKLVDADLPTKLREYDTKFAQILSHKTTKEIIQEWSIYYKDTPPIAHIPASSSLKQLPRITQNDLLLVLLQNRRLKDRVRILESVKAPKEMYEAMSRERNPIKRARMQDEIDEYETVVFGTVLGTGSGTSLSGC